MKLIIKYVFLIIFFFPMIGNGQIEYDTINHTIEFDSKKLNYLKDQLLTEYFSGKNKDSLKINFTSQGCFHFEEELLELVKMENDSLKISFFSKSLYGSKPKFKYEVIKSLDFIKKIIAFEKAGKNIRDFGCTTVNFFVLESEGLGSVIYDASCDWEGYEKLKLAIQLPENQLNKKAKNISRRKYQGKIFRDDYKLNFELIDFDVKQRFTPSKDEIHLAEKIIKNNKLVRKESSDYGRQYLGFVNGENQKVILVNFVKYYYESNFSNYYNYLFLIGCNLSRKEFIFQKVINLETKSIEGIKLEIENCRN